MNYATPESLDEAYALLTKNKKNMILAENDLLKMEDIQIPTVIIDLAKTWFDQMKKMMLNLKLAMVTFTRIRNT